MRKTLVQITRIAVAGVLLMSLNGCYGDIKDYCEVKIKCLGGNENDEEACVEQYKTEKRVSKEYDCKDEWKDQMECMADQVECDETFNVPTGEEDCVTEITKWQECIQRGSELL